MTANSSTAPDTPVTDRQWLRAYTRLRRVARRELRREGPGQTLQPTALVHEAYFRLRATAPADSTETAEPEDLLAHAGCTMRRILIDRARSRLTAKRGGGWQRQHLDDDFVRHERDTLLLQVDDAVARLGEFDAELARLVELRYFAGLGFAETAPILGVSIPTAKRMWKLARGWLQRELAGS